MQERGLIHIYTGDGKGKTTAAVGLACRARGAGLRVLFVQLFKDLTSEKDVLEDIGVSVIQFKAKHPMFKDYSVEELAEEKKRCAQFISDACAMMEPNDLIVFDELGAALQSGWINPELALEIIKAKQPHQELVITGRGVLAEIMEHADYVTEMKDVKHPFRKGVAARRGIEF